MRLIPNALVVVVLSSLSVHAQPKRPATPADYGQWETLVPGQSDGGLSPDGKWLAYRIDHSNRNNELRITNLVGHQDKVIAFGVQPAFSLDSRWLAYGIELPEAAQDKLRKEKKPIHKKLGLLNLATGEQTVLESIETFAFSPNGQYLAMRRYVPEKTPPLEKKDDALTEPDAAAGATLIVRQLADARDTAFGNVAEFAWQDLERKGRLLALAISSGDNAGNDKAGNGLQLYDPQTGSLRVLDSSPSAYSGIAWRKNSADLAVLRARTDDRHDGPTQVALAWSRLGESSESKTLYDPTTTPTFPHGMRLVSYRKPSWSEEGDIVFLGISKWEEKPLAPKTSTPAKEYEEPAGVDVWHWRDTSVLPRQRIEAKQDREKNNVAAWHIAAGNLVALARSLDR